jgi:hypothetical protein
VLFAGSLLAQDSSKPKISAFFDRTDDGPAFFLECPNTSGETLSSGSERWTEAIRIDGTVQPEPKFRMPPGLTRNVAPKEIWRGILALRQSERSYFPAVKFGAMMRSARVLAIGEGKHTFAAQCGGVWSDDFTFYWDSEMKR